MSSGGKWLYLITIVLRSSPLTQPQYFQGELMLEQTRTTDERNLPKSESPIEISKTSNQINGNDFAIIILGDSAILPISPKAEIHGNSQTGTDSQLRSRANSVRAAYPRFNCATLPSSLLEILKKVKQTKLTKAKHTWQETNF